MKIATDEQADVFREVHRRATRIAEAMQRIIDSGLVDAETIQKIRSLEAQSMCDALDKAFHWTNGVYKI